MAKSDIPQMGAQSDADARAMAALGGGITDPDPQATARQAAEALSKAEGTSPPIKAGPAGQDTADGSQMTPAPVLNKSPKKDDDEDEDEDETEEEEEKSMGAQIPEDELLKSLDLAIKIARGGTSEPDPDRRAELAAKLSKGEIAADEADELHALIKSSLPPDETVDDDPDPMAKSYTEAALEDPDVQAGHQTDDGLDVSGWIGRNAAFVAGALDQINADLSGQMSKSFSQLAQVNLAMAKANRALGQRVLEQGELIKSLTGRLQTVEETPLPRVGASTEKRAAALSKSLPGADAASGLSRDQIVNGLTHLNKSSNDGKAPCGHDITEATARFESLGMIHPAMLADVKKVIAQ